MTIFLGVLALVGLVAGAVWLVGWLTDYGSGPFGRRDQ